MGREDGEYCSLSGDRWDCPDPDRWGCISGRETGNSLRSIARGYSDRKRQWDILLSRGDLLPAVHRVDPCIEFHYPLS